MQETGKENAKQDRKNNKKKWMILAVCAFAAAILLIGFIAGTWWMEKKAEQEYLAMQEKNAEKRQKVPEEEKKIDIPVDFDSLQKENPDIYAWITIPDTVIDYPIVQSSEDNAYYLNHSAEKTDSVSGAIYSENYNKKNFDDPITLLYGHNMKDGSMFAGLHKYEEDTYYIKRIIGMPGETVQIRDGYVYIDGKRLTSDVYGKEKIKDPQTAAEPVTLGDDEYFVMGDNRNHSMDSRDPGVGVLTRKDLIGRAWVRIYPFDKMGVIRHE